IFSQARILWPQEGQVEAGLDRVIGASFVCWDSGISRNASHWLRQSWCIIFGRRRMTTFRKLPMQRETSVTLRYRSQGVDRKVFNSAIQMLNLLTFNCKYLTSTPSPPAPLPQGERGG